MLFAKFSMYESPVCEYEYEFISQKAFNSLEMAFEDGYVCLPFFTAVRLITNDPLFFSTRKQ